jgi:site-specific recombinase XerD
MNDPSGTPIKVTVSVYTRHVETCPHKGKPLYHGRGCNCPKWLYVYDGTRDRRVSAKTRSWEKAEELAAEQRGWLNPDKQKIRKMEADRIRREQEAETEKSAVEAARITVEDAVARWLLSHKDASEGTITAYTSSANRIRAWSKRKQIVRLDEITPNLLDEWRGLWNKNAEHRDERMGPTTQSSFLVRLKAFFKWATSIKLIDEDPAKNLRRVRPQYAAIQPLTPKQFEKLLQAVDPFCQSQSGEVREWASEFRAQFLLQRATGMRLIDCLALPRAAVRRDRLLTHTKKTGAKVERRLPARVVEALAALSPKRERFKSRYFLWGEGINKLKTLSSRWGKVIAEMNPFLNFKDEQGKPFSFHSHQLRDSFAIELLLAGFMLEDVSRLLTHTSIQTTEKHYAPWVRRREEMLQARLEEALDGMGFGFS